MTVYVDDMYRSEMGRYRRMKMSHMIADSDDELHAMADRIGIARKHFQNEGSGPHYDIALSKRALAVEAGAVEITLRQCAYMNAIRRKTGKLGEPETCEAVFRNLYADKMEKWRKISEYCREH